MKYFSRITMLSPTILFLGCASTLDMEHNLDGFNGKVVAPDLIKNAQIVGKVKNGTIEYDRVFEKVDCRVIISVNRETRIVEGWRYHPVSKTCKKIHSYGHAW